MAILPVILSGGAGSRLWPLSRKAKPKQFLPLCSDKTMLQDTLGRLVGLNDVLDPLVVCNEEHRFLVAEQLREIGVSAERILLEPVGRNTAPAIALAALYAREKLGDPVLLVLPSDHVIADIQSFHEAIRQAAKHVNAGKLVTFGVVPNKAETGYGYIKSGEELTVAPGFVVEKFVEKPDLLTAKKYLASGDYYWNSGMFMLRGSKYLDELSHYRFDMFVACSDVYSKLALDGDFGMLSAELFMTCPSDSIDYAIMEKTNMSVVVPLDAGWNDVGSWAALAGIGKSDTEGNVVNGEALLHEAKNCYVRSDGRKIVLVGVSDLVVVESDDVVLVMDKKHSQEIKGLIRDN